MPNPNSGESLPGFEGINGSDNALGGAAPSCGLDTIECRPAGDAGVDFACTPTGPRDCSSDLDNDCDGQADNVVDDVCACVPGSVQTCEEHAGLDGRGPCRSGLQTCLYEEATLTSVWGPCEGSVGPGEQDSCSIAGDDTDCNGAPNTGCPCMDGETQDCGPSTTDGICRNGTSTCTNNTFGQCEGAIYPAARDSCVTRGDDSNCNGIPSEGCACINGETLPCGPDTDAGNCQPGIRTCVDGTFGQCVGAIFAAQSDSCAIPGDDANCNGIPNDGCGCIGSEARPCGPNTDVGNCQRGTQICVNGSLGECTGAVFPAQSDSCAIPGDDANCNGVANDGCDCVDGATRQCGPTTDAGICQRGTQTCVSGRFADCVGAIFATGRNCGSQQDNDCDGRPDNTIDNVCTCAIGATRACGTHPQDGVGSCRAGNQQCVAGSNNASSNFNGCSGSVGPAQADSCTARGNDANCDGTANGGCQCIGNVTEPCGTDVGNCQRGTKSCANGVFGQCVGEVTARGRDSCDVRGDDANCNGVANDGCGCVNGQMRACGPDTDAGVCQRGTETCSNEAFGQCVGAVDRASRNCSSQQDNDCDGRPDNTIDTVCTCAVGQTQVCNEHPEDGIGRCRAGQRRCAASPDNTSSAFSACTGAVGPAQRDSCTIPGDDSNCNGIPNDDCLEPLASPCSSNAECASGFCADGVCCAAPCNGPCMECNRATGSCNVMPADDNVACLDVDCDPVNECLADITNNRCLAVGQCKGTAQCASSRDPLGTTCGAAASAHQICNGNGTCVDPTVTCGSASCQIDDDTTCCYRGGQNSVVPECIARSGCVQGQAFFYASRVDCDNVTDCQTGEVCCFISASVSQISCTSPTICRNSPVSAAFPICSAAGTPVGVDRLRFPNFTCP